MQVFHAAARSTRQFRNTADDLAAHRQPVRLIHDAAVCIDGEQIHIAVRFQRSVIRLRRNLRRGDGAVNRSDPLVEIAVVQQHRLNEPDERNRQHGHAQKRQHEFCRNVLHTLPPEKR
ncbi:hypothetical protein SDC9_157357 [bioreactor metagenome]|uniref:Uncharacterized protein n=1 Tax=bioreactor metagenome TaxID=1076179 RepID=A0A645FBY0_9ZZZZ